jgi:aminobenzoyl-glutamate transport protein
VVYRIGDSVTNVISPMMSFFALIIAFIQKYDRKAGIGTIIATMMPYSIGFFLVWVVLLVAWLLIGIPWVPTPESITRCRVETASAFQQECVTLFLPVTHRH